MRRSSSVLAAAVQHDLARARGRGVRRSARRHGISQIVWSPLAQGVLTGKYKPGEEHPEDSRATSDEMGWAMDRYMADEVLDAVQRLRADRRRGRARRWPQLALAWVLRREERRLGDHRRLAARAGDRERFGVGIELSKTRSGGDRRGPRGRRRHRADARRLRRGRRQAPLDPGRPGRLGCPARFQRGSSGTVVAGRGGRGSSRFRAGPARGR